MNGEHTSKRWAVSAAGYLGLAGLFLSLAGSAHAVVIVKDGFSYPSGNLTGNNGGTSFGVNNEWSGAWALGPFGSANADWQVVNGQVETSGNVSADSFARRAFKESLGLTTYYFGFRLYIPAGANQDLADVGVYINPVDSNPYNTGALDAALYTEPTTSGGITNVFLRGALGNSGSVGGATP